MKLQITTKQMINQTVNQIQDRLLFLASQDRIDDALALANEWYEVLDSEEEIKLFFAPDLCRG